MSNLETRPAEVTAGPASGAPGVAVAGPAVDRQRFDLPVADTLPPLPASSLPAVTLRPRS